MTPMAVAANRMAMAATTAMGMSSGHSPAVNRAGRVPGGGGH